MNIRALAAVILILFGCGLTYAQKSKTKPKIASVLEGRFELENTSLVPEVKDFAYVIEIDENSNISLTVQTSEDVKFLTNTANTAPIGSFFSGVSTPGSFQPIVIVRAAPTLNFGTLTDVINKIRNSSKLRIKLEAAPAYYVIIPAKPDKPLNYKTRPNPLSLVVSLDGELNIKLNGEPQGNLSDTIKLYDFLKQIFRDREANGVFRSGSNEVETTVFVKADRSAAFSDVIKLIDTIRAAGALPVGLQMDDLK